MAPDCRVALCRIKLQHPECLISPASQPGLLSSGQAGVPGGTDTGDVIEVRNLFISGRGVGDDTQEGSLTGPLVTVWAAPHLPFVSPAY